MTAKKFAGQRQAGIKPAFTISKDTCFESIKILRQGSWLQSDRSGGLALLKLFTCAVRLDHWFRYTLVPLARIFIEDAGVMIFGRAFNVSRDKRL